MSFRFGMKHITILTAGVASLLFLACSVPEELSAETCSPAVVFTSVPTASPIPATATPVPTDTPEPEPTPIPRNYYSPATRMSFAELVADNGNYDLPRGYPSPDTYRVTVDLTHQVVLVYTKNDDGSYSVPVRYMLCSTGLNGSTPCGVFNLLRYRVRFGLFRNDNTYGQYWTLIKGRIYFHSTLYSERDADTYIGETYDLLGSPASHGCIRLTVPDARWIYYNLGYGTEIEIREGDPLDAATAAIRDSLILPERPVEHVRLFPGCVDNTDNWKIEDVPAEIPYKEGSQSKQK